MALKYGLTLNHLTKNPDDYKGIITDVETVTTEQIVEKMIGKGSTVTKAEALSVIEEFSSAVEDAISQGKNVNTDLFKITPSMSGVFTSAQDSFDSNRHSIRLNLNAGNRLVKAIENIELRKVAITTTQPVLHIFTDIKTNAINERFTPGQIASIKGSMLKFDEQDDAQGIYFIDSDGKSTKVSQVVKNKPSELLFFVPEGLNGTFQVEVRAKVHNHKTIRKGRLNSKLKGVV
ncbi:DUF4469 domain-containing protein [Labilibacter sediminis]|nr:DUF4469 domain-containing protein [Labilibacter sediminis]